MKADRTFKILSIGIVSFWLSLFVVSAIGTVITVSLLQKGSHDFVNWHFTLENYQRMLNPLSIRIFVRSLSMAVSTTILCFIFGYPFAYFLWQLPKSWKTLVTLLLIIPFWTSSLIRSYAIIALLKAHGVVNSVLLAVGLIDSPLRILFSNTAVLIGLVYNLLPFMIFPLYAKFERLDLALVHAARDLGASQWTIIRRVIFPLSIPGVMAGVLLVFLPAMTLFYIPDLLGGAHSMLLGNLIQFQFLTVFNWPAGAATSFLLTTLLVILIAINQLFRNDREDSK